MEFTYHLNGRGMSGRIVKFRVLDTDEVEAEETNGSNSAGEGADSRRLRREQLKYLLSAMIVAYTAPDQAHNQVPIPKNLVARAGGDTMAKDPGVASPEAMKLADAGGWIKANAGTLVTSWKSIFNTKDTEALKYIFTEYHELSHLEVMMLSGKSQPVPTGV